MAEKKVDGVEAVAKQVEEQSEQGYRGIVPDTTPNSHYTVAGVTAGKPTPETDEAHAKKVKDNLPDLNV